jgi:Flp pilus assembly CpaE family ATPase
MPSGKSNHGERNQSPLKAITVLLVEDSSDYAALVLRWLSGDSNQTEFIVNWADSLSAALARIDHGGIDVILMDLGLPDSDGLSTFLSIRDAAADSPIIVLSARDSENLALQTIQQGAQDYLVKSTCTSEQLMRTLRYTTVRHQSSRRHARAEESINSSKIIGVVGASGGAGATTVACVLAAELRRQTDEPTLLLDLDSSPGMAAFTMGIDSRYSLADALRYADRLDESLWEGLITRGPGRLDVLSSAKALDEDDDTDPNNLRKIVAYARGSYKWIVIDYGRLNLATRLQVKWADEVMLVAGPTIPGLHQCKRTISLFDDLGIPREHLRLIINPRDNERHLSGKEIQNLFGIEICAVLGAAHDELYNACLKKRLPLETDDFRMELGIAVRKLAGLPLDVPKRPLLSLNSIADKLLYRGEVTK